VTVGVYGSEDSYIDAQEPLLFEVRELVGGVSVETITDAVYGILASWANW
jgi:hypothetical protein